MHTAGVRSYNPRLGRWINRDPIGEKGGENIYAFVSNIPINITDVCGMMVFSGGIIDFMIRGIEIHGVPSDLWIPYTLERTMTAYKITGLEYAYENPNSDWVDKGTPHLQGAECDPEKDSVDTYTYLGSNRPSSIRSAKKSAISNYLNNYHYSRPSDITVKVIFYPIIEETWTCVCKEKTWQWDSKFRQIGELAVRREFWKVTRTKVKLTLRTSRAGTPFPVRTKADFYPNDSSLDELGMPTESSPVEEESPTPQLPNSPTPWGPAEMT